MRMKKGQKRSKGCIEFSLSYIYMYNVLLYEMKSRCTNNSLWTNRISDTNLHCYKLDGIYLRE